MRTYLQEREHWVTVLKQELDRVREKDWNSANFLNKCTNTETTKLELSKATKKDIGVLLDCYIDSKTHNKKMYDACFQTKLYNKHSCEYCELLEYLSYIDGQRKFENLKLLRAEYMRKKRI